MKQFYTVKEVAIILNCSSQKVRRLCDSGKLRAVDLNEKETGARSCYRIPKKEIDQLLTPVLKKEKLPITIFETGSMMEFWHNHSS